MEGKGKIVWGENEELAIKKGETITANYIIYTIDDYILAGRKGNWVFSDYVAIKGSDILPDYLLHKNSNNEIVWISDWYKDVIQLSHTEAIKYINKKIPSTQDLYFADSDTYWYEDYASYPFGIDFTNILLNIRFLGRSGYHFLIKNIEKQKQDYIITCLATEKYDWSDINLKCVDFDNFPNPNNTFTLKVSPSKDSVKIFNIETGKLIFSLIPVSNMWIESFQDFLKTGNNPFISELPFPNVAPSKIMSVKENLKLRSGEATTTSVLAVMSAGTKVKILALGKQATIDGITSNWVQVEVQAGAKDRDGKPIAAGTVGWVFGGYLGIVAEVGNSGKCFTGNPPHIITATERKDGKGKHLHLSVYNTEDYDTIWNNDKKVLNFKTNGFLCNPFNHTQNYYKD